MVGVSASVNHPLHHKVKEFSSGTGSPFSQWVCVHRPVVLLIVLLLPCPSCHPVSSVRVLSGSQRTDQWKPTGLTFCGAILLIIELAPSMEDENKMKTHHLNESGRKGRIAPFILTVWRQCNVMWEAQLYIVYTNVLFICWSVCENEYERTCLVTKSQLFQLRATEAGDRIIMVALCNRADHYIFILFLLSSSFFFLFFPCLISAVGDWMFTILWHMVWP